MSSPQLPQTREDRFPSNSCLTRRLEVDERHVRHKQQNFGVLTSFQGQAIPTLTGN